MAFPEGRGTRCRAAQLGVCNQTATEKKTFPHPACKFPAEDLADALKEGIVVGQSPMPRFVFAPTEASDLITLFETLELAR